jgi:hypothetical protein
MKYVMFLVGFAAKDGDAAVVQVAVDISIVIRWRHRWTISPIQKILFLAL